MLVGKKEGYIQKRGEHHLPDWEESPKYFYLFLFSLLHAYLCTILLLCALKDNIFANIWEIRTWTDWQAIKSPSYKRISLCIIPQKWGENQKKILSIHSIIRPMKSWRISSCNSLYIEKKNIIALSLVAPCDVQACDHHVLIVEALKCFLKWSCQVKKKTNTCQGTARRENLNCSLFHKVDW